MCIASCEEFERREEMMKEFPGYNILHRDILNLQIGKIERKGITIK